MSTTAIKVKKSSKGDVNTKAKKEKQASADKATAAAVIKKITEKKELLYKYPEDVDTLEKRKIYRAKVRRGLDKLLKTLKMATKGKIETKPEEIEKQINAFKKEHYMPTK